MEDIFNKYYVGTDESLQHCLIALKEQGHSQMDAAKLLISQLKLTLREADVIVLNAKAWEKEKDANVRFREGFEKALLGNEE